MLRSVTPTACRWAAALVCGVACFALGTADNPASRPLGLVEEANHAEVRGASAVTGASLYAGDAVKTDEQGRVRLRLGEGRVYLSASSCASLEQRGGVATVTLAEGSATFSLPDPTQFELETPVGVLRGSGTKATGGQVRIVKLNEVVISTTHGDLVLDNDGEFYTLARGKSYRVIISADSGGATRKIQTAHNEQHTKRTLVLIPVKPASVV